MNRSAPPALQDADAPVLDLRANFAARVDIVTLKLFIAVAEEASIAKAAEREHMAPSAVSKRLADLEQAVRVPLLERHRRGVSPTSAGEAFLRHSRKILRDLTQLECEMGEFSSTSHGARGHVRAAANESALFGFFPDALSRFMRDHPNVTVELQPNTSTGAVQAVREGVVEFGIFWGDQPVDGLKVMPCYVDRLVVVVPQGHPLCRRRGLRFVDLLDHALILQEPYSSIQNLTERLAAEAGRTLHARIRVAGFDAVCRMAQAGLGIGIVPDYFVADRAAAMHIEEVPLDEPWANRLHKLCIRKDEELATATRLLVEFLSS
ncbi:LysR family transcriptional regulator [Caballeronia sp. LZ035]|uniref:LysR family transcriptional regulator n=1 Tax=Caballeronia sp. LZ035 TaxID=3038568 RepID=UPI002863C9B2|nr:LysR family transcriptional regulator [Caballeronia sp. LZ035]MDR5758995.1 LysR family transcriptional regulator [Caballeronia sp. LZ035]